MILHANYQAEHVRSAFLYAVNDLDREKKLPQHSEEIITGQLDGEYPPEQMHAYTPEEQNRFMKDLFAPHGGLIGYAAGEVAT